MQSVQMCLLTQWVEYFSQSFASWNSVFAGQMNKSNWAWNLAIEWISEHFARGFEFRRDAVCSRDSDFKDWPTGKTNLKLASSCYYFVSLFQWSPSWLERRSWLVLHASRSHRTQAFLSCLCVSVNRNYSAFVFLISPSNVLRAVHCCHYGDWNGFWNVFSSKWKIEIVQSIGSNVIRYLSIEQFERKWFNGETSEYHCKVPCRR